MCKMCTAFMFCVDKVNLMSTSCNLISSAVILF